MATAPNINIEQERMLRGLGVSSGIAIGLAFVVDTGGIQVPEYTLDAKQIETERERFAEATTKARRQIRKLKTKAIASLPARRREAFVLNRIEGLSYDEIAERMKISRNTVISTIVNAMADLDRKLR